MPARWRCCSTRAGSTFPPRRRSWRRSRRHLVAPAVGAPIVLDDARPVNRVDGAPTASAVDARTGRELELAQLLDMVDAAQAAHELRGMLVTAPPGMGKSWLLDAAAARAAADGATVLRAT